MGEGGEVDSSERANGERCAGLRCKAGCRATGLKSKCNSNIPPPPPSPATCDLRHEHHQSSRSRNELRYATPRQYFQSGRRLSRLQLHKTSCSQRSPAVAQLTSSRQNAAEEEWKKSTDEVAAGRNSLQRPVRWTATLGVRAALTSSSVLHTLPPTTPLPLHLLFHVG